MLFNSSIFILLFLPATLCGFYLLAGANSRNYSYAWLVLASLFFYGWWNPAYVPLIVASVLVNFSVGRLLGAAEGLVLRRALLIAGVAFNLGLLGYFKYANFLVDTVNSVSGADFHLQAIVLPLAISFFTFQQIAYIADVYGGRVKEYNLIHYSLFVTFFPQLIAGPIVHHGEMMPQFARDDVRKARADNLAVGASLFVMGLVKKVVLADSVAPYATNVFTLADGGATVAFADAWVGSTAYMMQLYFDFSGYSDMALGLGRMFGIRLPLNFSSPYQTSSIIDSCNRWHMTLSRFLRDYVFLPLNRLGPRRRAVNLFLVMLVAGLWHGAAWTFVFWGGLLGLYLMINYAWRGVVGQRGAHLLPVRLSYRVLTLLAILVSLVFFRAETFAGALSMLESMAGLNGLDLPAWLQRVPLVGAVFTAAGASFLPDVVVVSAGYLWVAALLAIALGLPNTQQIMREHMHGDGFRYRIQAPKGWQAQLLWRASPLLGVLYGLAALYVITSLWKPSEFLYFQF